MNVFYIGLLGEARSYVQRTNAAGDVGAESAANDAHRGS